MLFFQITKKKNSSSSLHRKEKLEDRNEELEAQHEELTATVEALMKKKWQFSINTFGTKHSKSRDRPDSLQKLPSLKNSNYFFRSTHNAY
jgi:hypothetical protein